MNCLFAAALVGAVSTLAPAQILWQESLQGDLSDDRLDPTDFALAEGGQLLLGVLSGGDGEGNIDRDYFSVSVPAGAVLARMDLIQYFSQDFAAFIGIDRGPVFSISPEEATPDALFGWALFGGEEIGEDLLPLMGENGTGFMPPLPEGVYTFWVQQTGEATVWAANFFVEEVPGPGAVWVLALGVTRMSRRRRSGVRVACSRFGKHASPSRSMAHGLVPPITVPP